MSCIRFSTDAQRAQFRAAAPAMLTPEQAVQRHPVPAMTESKLRRLRLLAIADDPKIRESVASNRHTPPDVLVALATDPDDGVRGCLARNPIVSASVIRALADDRSDRVRGWIAVHPSIPEDVSARLGSDPSDVVRGLFVWRESIDAAL